MIQGYLRAHRQQQTDAFNHRGQTEDFDQSRAEATDTTHQFGGSDAGRFFFRLKLRPGHSSSAAPVKFSDKVCLLTLSRPRAGSWIMARSLFRLTSTTKWLKFQCRLLTLGNDSNLLIVIYCHVVPDDFVMQFN